MTNYAVLYDPGPSGILPGGGALPLTNGRLTVANDANDTVQQVNGGLPMAAGSGCFGWEITINSSASNYWGFGIISASYSSATGLVSAGAQQGFVVQSDGNCSSQGGYAFTLGFTTGNTYRFHLNTDCTPPLLWVANGTGPWNGNSSAAPSNSPTATASATGGYPLASITPPFCACIAFNTGSGQATANFGATAYVYGLLSGFSNVPPNGVLAVSNVISAVGSPAQITWADSNGGTASGLNYALNGGTFTACGGVVDGTSGLATVPVIEAQAANSLILQDAANPLNCAPAFWFPSLSRPSGAGALLATAALSITQPGSEYTISGSLSAANPTIIIEWGMNEQCSVAGTTNGAPGLFLGGEDSASNTFSTAFQGYWVATDGTAGQQFGVSGLSPTTGPLSVPIVLSTSVTGTLSVAGGHFNATISNNGTIVTYFNDSGSGAYNTWAISFGAMYPFVPAVTMTTYLGIWAPALPETLTITGASYTSGTLTVIGTYANADLTEASISTNDGLSFAAATTLDAGSGVYTATLLGTMAAGTYHLVTEDALTEDQSNVYPYVINGPGAFPLMVLAFA
jgi:hypothetical protein